ncbi:MAG: hypothetical protein ACOX6P_00675 [Candidatus Merdivicinus sp.]|jgi:hypothetical protein
MGWIITGGILLFLVIVLSLSVAVDVSYEEELIVSAGLCGLRYPIFPALEKEKKDKKPKKHVKAKKSAKSSRVSKKKPLPEKKPEKGDLKGTFDIVMDLIRASVGPILDLICRIRMVRLEAEIRVGGQDASEIALDYGKICGIFYGGYATLQNLIKVRVKRVDISCDFLAPETRQVLSFQLKLRILWILWAILRIGWSFLAHTIRKENQWNPDPLPKSKVPLSQS